MLCIEKKKAGLAAVRYWKKKRGGLAVLMYSKKKEGGTQPQFKVFFFKGAHNFV